MRRHTLSGFRLYIRLRGQELKGEDPEAAKSARARAKARQEPKPEAVRQPGAAEGGKS